MDEHRKMEINSDRTIPTAISMPPPTHNEGGKKLFRRERFNSTETEINAGMKFRRGRERGMAQLSTAPMHVGAVTMRFRKPTLG